jgi:hypothetical protein
VSTREIPAAVASRLTNVMPIPLCIQRAGLSAGWRVGDRGKDEWLREPERRDWVTM